MRSRDNKRAQAILAAADAILAESGVEGLSARVIAERAEVPKGLVFYYWDSTAALVDDVLERYYRRHADALAIAAANDAGPLPDRMHRVIDAYLDFMEQHRTYARIVQHQVSSTTASSPVVKHYLAQLLALTTQLLEGVTPATGPLSAKHFHLSLSSVVVNYFTYAPAIGTAAWGAKPLSRAALRERREHVHWLVDAMLARLGAA